MTYQLINQSINLKKTLESMTNYPGVYQMFDNFNKILYIGKAKNLRNRVNSYFNNQDRLSRTSISFGSWL